MKQEPGFILLLTLTILMVMSLLLLSSMHQLLLSQRALAHRALQHHLFYQLEHVIRDISRLNKSVWQPCILEQDAANDVLKQVIQKKGCVIAKNNVRFQYIVEDLGTYSCVLIKQHDIDRATHHWRISVRSLAEKKNPMMIIQVRIIQPANEDSTCALIVHHAKAGISSWRFLHYNV